MIYQLHQLTIALHIPVMMMALFTLFFGFFRKKRAMMHCIDAVISLTSLLMSFSFVNAQVAWIVKNRDSQITDVESMDWIMFDLSFPVVIFLILIRLWLKE